MCLINRDKNGGNMKIGIINYFNYDNYGAVLQAYALQQIVSELGFKNELINYDCFFQTQHYKLIHTNNLYKVISDILYFKDRFIKKIEFNTFRVKYLEITKIQYDISTISNTVDEFDMFITGSDQVFNYKCTDFDKNYFLDFVKQKKKVAYGASFGMNNIPVELINTYKKLLVNFNFLSCREKEGTKICNDIFSLKCKTVLDPTLLASKDIWNFDNCKVYNEEYILVYMLERSDSLLEFTSNIAKKMNLKVYYIGSLTRAHRNGLKGKFFGHVSPDEFVNLFNHATYVVTNSFHGTAFSIIFEKVFFVEKLKINKDTNSRFDNILSTLDLEDRFIDAEYIPSLTIDYNKVNKLLEIERRNSISFLKGAIEND